MMMIVGFPHNKNHRESHREFADSVHTGEKVSGYFAIGNTTSNVNMYLTQMKYEQLISCEEGLKQRISLPSNVHIRIWK